MKRIAKLYAETAALQLLLLKVSHPTRPKRRQICVSKLINVDLESIFNYRTRLGEHTGWTQVDWRGNDKLYSRYLCTGYGCRVNIVILQAASDPFELEYSS